MVAKEVGRPGLGSDRRASAIARLPSRATHSQVVVHREVVVHAAAVASRSRHCRGAPPRGRPAPRAEALTTPHRVPAVVNEVIGGEAAEALLVESGQGAGTSETGAAGGF